LDNKSHSEDSEHQAYGHQDDKTGLGRLQANVHNGEQDERANDSTASLNAVVHFLVRARLVFPRDIFKLQRVAMLT